MSILFIKENSFKYNELFFDLDDMFNAQLFEVCNEIAEETNCDLDIVNEVFLNRFQPFKAIELFLSGFDIKYIKLENPDEKLIPLVLDFAIKRNIRVKGLPPLFKIRNKVHGHINIILSSIYLIYKMIAIPYSSRIKSDKDNISLIRTYASRKKLGFLDEVDFRYENINETQSIYNCFRKSKRIMWVFKSWIVSYKKTKEYTNFINETIGTYSSNDAYKYYSVRIVHTLLYSIILDNFFRNNSGKNFYTGNNLDRFALIEEKIAKKYNINIVCIPHGLEYGFRLPHCFVGDKFFATSLNASLHLNELYNTKKFIFNQNIAYETFSVNYKKKHKKDIVFFTEPREVEVNCEIIEELIPLLNSKNLKLSLKLHPKDEMSHYEKFSKEITYIEDFNESITENICISRKSTILLEAVYNNSDASAILINSKDKEIFNTFPSLQDKHIKSFNSIEKLFKWILEITENY